MLILSDAHGNRVDLSGGLRGLDLQAFARALNVPSGGEMLRLIGREDLLAMQCFAEEPIDLDLVRRVTRRFGRAAVDVPEQVLAH
jgi:hypothetical protein